MICAETREIWKKSGAWFFKSIPKYVLPGQRINKTDEDSSSEDERKFVFRTERRNSGTESTYGKSKYK